MNLQTPIQWLAYLLIGLTVGVALFMVLNHA